MKVQLKCKACGKEFWVKPYRKKEAKYCSRECYAKDKAVKMKNKPPNFGSNHYWNNSLKIGIICGACGKLKKIHLSLYLSGQRTCSLKCRDVLRRKYPLRAICKNCGNEFRPDPCSNLVFCNRACYVEHKKKNAKRKIVCEHCGKEIEVSGHRNYYRYHNGNKKIRKYCSRLCVNMDKTGIRGEDHFNWKGGKTDLQDLIRKSSYAQSYRHEVFKRDRWESVLSGKNGRLIHHHLTAFSILIKQNEITKDNWIDFKDVLFDLDNAVTLTKREHDKFHSLYGKISTPEQFKEFRQRGRPQ